MYTCTKIYKCHQENMEKNVLNTGNCVNLFSFEVLIIHIVSRLQDIYIYYMNIVVFLF